VATTAQRRELLALMDYCIAHRGNIHYPPGDVRRERVATIRSWVDIHERVMRPGGWTVDCSQMAEALHRAVGLHLPFRDGFTGSYLEHLAPHYTDGRAAYVGAPVVFGPGTGHHMALVHTRDTKHGNPLLFSHGQEADPRLIYLSQEQAYQPYPHTFCSIAKL
jgi:hypothetical protein